MAVVVTFEVGADRGDKPGEFQFWVERENWQQKIDVPGVDHPVLTDGRGTIGVVSGATVRASNQIMALGLSGKSILSKTYWLVNGIAGVNPAAASIGSAAWAHYVIDGDVAYEIDSREADASWPYAIIPIGSKVPNQKPTYQGWEPEIMAYPLNPRLVAWAYALTKDTPIPDSDAMKAYRALYAGYPNAQKPPFVLYGETFGSCRYWHGSALTRWASDWARTGPGAVTASWRCPTNDGLRTYLRHYKRERELPVTYERLRGFREVIPLTDLDGKPTLWDTVIYDGQEMRSLNEALKEVYALIKVDGDMSVVPHLYADRVDFCTFGNTTPFRIRIVNAYNDNQDYFYIKKADASRAYGLELEHLLSPNRLNFITHGSTLVEEHIAGHSRGCLHRPVAEPARPEARPGRQGTGEVQRALLCAPPRDMRSYNSCLW